MPSTRQIKRLIASQPTSDGDGVKIFRLAGFNDPAYSPYLMIDELKSDSSADYIGGFPPHPHRGIETLTYMLNGHFQHRDHLGHVGELRSGGAQWMSAGRGIIHSEMPIMKDGQLHGFQIWINLPSHLKMAPAKYHDFQPDTITEYQDDSLGLIRVISGQIELAGQPPLNGPLQDSETPFSISDWRPNAGQTITINTPVEEHTLVYVYKGKVQSQGKTIEQGYLAQFTLGDELTLAAEENTGLLILSGQPINEPVVHYGPFVMNSVAEIEQAISDFNNGEFEKY